MPDPLAALTARLERLLEQAMNETDPARCDDLSAEIRQVLRERERLNQRDSTKLSLQGWVRNLSESGVGAFVADALIPGESVTLEIPVPDCGKQVIPAKVVRALGTEYGFQFTALSADQRRQIRATLRECPTIPYHNVGQ